MAVRRISQRGAGDDHQRRRAKPGSKSIGLIHQVTVPMRWADQKEMFTPEFRNRRQHYLVRSSVWRGDSSGCR